MALITMGYGHLTVITMGLGNSIRIIRQEIFYPVGVVEFQDTTPKVRIDDRLIATSFEDKKVIVEVSEKPQKDVSFEE